MQSLSRRRLLTAAAPTALALAGATTTSSAAAAPAAPDPAVAAGLEHSRAARANHRAWRKYLRARRAIEAEGHHYPPFVLIGRVGSPSGGFIPQGRMHTDGVGAIARALAESPGHYPDLTPARFEELRTELAERQVAFEEAEARHGARGTFDRAAVADEAQAACKRRLLATRATTWAGVAAKMRAALAEGAHPDAAADLIDVLPLLKSAEADARRLLEAGLVA